MLDPNTAAIAPPPRRGLLDRLGVRSVTRAELARRHTGRASRFIEIMGAQVHYTDQGTGDILIMLHGFASSLHTWDALADDLARDHRVIRLDLPPFGVTGPLRDAHGEIVTMNLPAYRRFIDTFIGALGIEQASWVGNSLGGLIAWDFAARHRQRNEVQRLVLVDSAGFPMKLPIYIDLFNHAMVRWSAPWLLPDAIVKSAVRNVYGDASRLEPATLARYVDFFHGEGTREAIGKMVPTLDFHDVETGRLMLLDLPALVLWGAKDRWIPPEHMSQFMDRLPDARAKMYPDLGHIPMEEAPGEVIADLRAFLADTADVIRRPENAAAPTGI